MSEIFNFLKQTGTDKRKSSSASETEAELLESASDPQTEVPEPHAATIAGYDTIQPAPEVAPFKFDMFDLSAANIKIKTSLDPHTIVGEQFRLLRTKLALLGKEKHIRTVLVTSSVPEEGKTFTAFSLAGVFAQEQGKRVVLIDCDMRKPKSGWSLGVNDPGSNIGMSELLQGNISFPDTLMKSTDSDLYFVPSGPLPQNPTELLSSPILEQTIKGAADIFDWVIIDSPPVLALSDADLLAPLCDRVLLVVRANFTPSKLIKETINRIGKDKICGVVFNRQKQKYPAKYYYKYYYGNSSKRKEQ